MNKYSLRVIQADITILDVDAVVNAANADLAVGAGVCGAIHRAAGPGLEEECRSIGRCPTGKAVLTGGHELRARFVIHAVAPNYVDDPSGAPELLKSAYISALSIADQHQIRSIAFPCLGTGIYGFPKDRAARIAVETASSFMKTARQVDHVIFCCFEAVDYEYYMDLMSE